MQYSESQATAFRLWICYHKNLELSIFSILILLATGAKNKMLLGCLKYNLTKQITCGIIIKTPLAAASGICQSVLIATQQAQQKIRHI